MAAQKPRSTSFPTALASFVRALCALAFFALLVAIVGPSHARAPQAGKDGLFITVPNPITENAVHDISRRVSNAVERQGRTLSVVVFDFNPKSKPAGTVNVFPCMQLSDYITRLRLGQLHAKVQTVAYIHDEITEHTVLPALACHELVMSSKGKFGHALGRQDKPLPKEAKQAYEQVVKSWPDPPTLLTKLMEPSKDLSMYDLQAAQKAGLCKALMESRVDVKDMYELVPRSLREDALGDRTPVVWRIEVHGGLNPGKLNSLERRIDEAIRKKANVIILHLACEGGETVDAAAMAEKLRNLTDDGGVLPVKTIAYVPPGVSLGAATFLALGCSEIAMARDAKLGGFQYLKNASPEELTGKQRMLVELARTQGYPVDVFQSMLDPKELLNLDAETAYKRGIAQHKDVESPEVLFEHYGFDASKVHTSRSDLLDAIAAFLREPIVNVFLIMIGVAGLILELKVPGFGVPGIVAAICFVLFFWAHAFAGQSSWEFTLLAVLLFILGLVMLGIEVFLLPGFGITGISGIILVLVSMVLVILEKTPTTTQEWMSVGSALATVSGGLIGGMAVAMVIARYLPNIPYANRLVLEPPVDQDLSGGPGLTQEGLEASALLGAIGVALTTLRPSGKAQFDDKYLDVMAEGDFVDAGARVQIIEIEGNRIVVKETC